MRGVGHGAWGNGDGPQNHPGTSSVCQSVGGCCWGVDVTGCDEPNPLLQPSACLPNSLQGPLSSWSCCLLPTGSWGGTNSRGEGSLPSFPPPTPADPGPFAGLILIREIKVFHQKKKKTLAPESDATPAAAQCPLVVG